jgi:glycine C-acetyltransferase
MTHLLETRLRADLDAFRRDGVYKQLNWLDSPQAPRVRMEGRGEVIILSSNNYLGLCDDPEVVRAGKDALDRYGAGTGSVRFICGTFTIHRELERACADLVGTEASLSFVSCWNANEALPGTVLTEHDLVLSDQLNHASIIDGIRLAKAITKCQTGVFRHGDLDDLRAKLRAAADRKVKMVITDGIFSMEGAIAKLPELAQLCREEGAVLVVDDSHATGVLGATGRGTAEHFGMVGEVDIITSTLGKALGGAAGGFVAGSGRSATTSPSAPAPSSSPMPSRRPWRAAPSPASGCSSGNRTVSRHCARTPATSGASSWSQVSARFRAKRRSSRSSSARPRRPSGCPRCCSRRGSS